LSALMHPPLTTVRYPIVEMGAMAIDRLLNTIGTNTIQESTRENDEELQHQLIVRSSTCPPNPNR
ncbi:MAG: LacI family DNA-binding transcriptional regulator, partial [Spirochaetaceae bacterium]|nr:LacI family DNA-binding transcriptional regulator [Spirochaetaceae bacterium]